MCHTIIINRGDKEIRTPREFEEHFGFPAKGEPYYGEIIQDACLCQVDVEGTFRERGIEFKEYCGDYYVGELDLITDQ